jgi:hypothetical protein
MQTRKLAIGLSLALPTLFGTALAQDTDTVEPIKALIITGGCCHDYPQQREILEEGLSERLNIEITHLYLDPPEDWPHPAKTRTPIPVQSNPNYGDGYDVIIHNECTADIRDPAIRRTVLTPHLYGIPGVNLHCAMHSYRPASFRQAAIPGTEDASWFEYVGIQSSGHGEVSPIELSIATPDHPITTGLELWDTGDEELYNNLTMFDVTPLISGVQPNAPIEADRDKPAVVAWAHEYGPEDTKVFSVTLAHFETEMNDNYLDLVARGVAWATDNINDDGSFAEGYAAVAAP